MENGLDLQQTPTEEEHPPQIHELPFSLLPYPQMIMEAIEASGNECNKTAIVKHMESSLTQLPPSHLTLLNYHLNQMKQSGQVVLVRNNYMKPGPNRGRRPSNPEPQGDSSHVEVTFPSLRPRRRPPKSNDSSSVPDEETEVPPPRRPRGRPPKKTKKTVRGDDDGAKTQGSNGVVRRGRGRPRKVKLLSELTD